METNIKAFKKLIDLYEQLDKEELRMRSESVSPIVVLYAATGFGRMDTCGLCLEANEYAKVPDVVDDWDEVCKYCIYTIASGDVCCEGVNKETFRAIKKVKDFDELVIAIRNRAKHMRELLEIYNKLKQYE